ncbi:MAG: phosphopentomutase [Verrucomicrobiota bacterium]
MPCRRAFLIVLDSVGIGHAPDAARFGDEGSNTVGHIREGVSGFAIPNLDRSGLQSSEDLAANRPITASSSLSFGCLTEQSAGKDTITGHWELAGAPLPRPFATFARFPPALVKEMEKTARTSFLGNYAQSGTVILDELGEEHLATKQPILYTSADSVIQVAAHEETFGLERLYEVCRQLRIIADREKIGRVIARPFLGTPGKFTRSSNRRDFSIKPPPTILDHLKNSGVETIGVGKIADIFAGSGISESHPTSSNDEGCATIQHLATEPLTRDRFIFANLVDFDMLFGHRRDPRGYGRALEKFDVWLGKFLPFLGTDELLMITADHGNDPTWSGSDHTRERVPLLVHEPKQPRNLGIRDSFADVAASLADWFLLPLPENGYGKSFLS